jgi:hypothetical protein
MYNITRLSSRNSDQRSIFMGDQHGGIREGAGRKKGSKNKMTIAKEVIGEIIDAPDPMKLSSAIHQRGHTMLLELERIALDPTQPVAARIMAARTALPFMLPKLPEPKAQVANIDALSLRIQEGRNRLATLFIEPDTLTL